MNYTGPIVYMERKKKILKNMSGSRILALGFAVAILVGTVLLCLPVATAKGETTSLVDALFTATTSICVTGLVTVPTFSHWSLFGQAVILCLIQLGGLGVVTCSMIAFLIVRKKLTIKNRRLIQESYNLDNLSGMVNLVRRVVFGTLTVETIGAVLYMFQFVPEYGPRGIWIAVFNSVSAFCNAGIDIIGPESLRPYVGNPLVNFTTIFLIIVAGIGFIVWWDVKKILSDVLHRRIYLHKCWDKLQFHTKIVLFTTALLIFGGALLIFIFEWGNPDTIGNMGMGEKIMACLFQSVTTRTAGFETIAQNRFTDSSGIISMLMMFVGGSPMGTAGGVKTTTMAVLVLTTIAYFRGKKNTDVFHRQISEDNRRTATVVVMTMVGCLFSLTILLSAATGFSYLDVSYEITSAIATVGLTRGITAELPFAGKLIVIFTMYIGRIGPITMATAVARRSKEANTSIERPEKRIIIG